MTPSKKRVLMLLENSFYPRDSRVRKEVKSLTSAGYKVSVIAPSSQGQKWLESLNGVRVYRYPIIFTMSNQIGYFWEYSYAMILTFALSLFVLAQGGFDILHAHNPPDTFVIIAAFYKVFGKRFVFDHHDLAPEIYFARFEGKGNRMIFKVLVFWEKISLKLTDRVIATNQSHKRIEKERGGIPEKRITVVRNGPDLNRFQSTDTHQNLNVKGKTNIVYAGTMGFHDGVDYLLRAIYHLRYNLDSDDFHCTLVGDGDAWNLLNALSKELIISTCLSFAGRVDPIEVPSYLKIADICVAPEPSNPYNDSLTAIKIMEYMAMGKPIVDFDLPENRFTAQTAAVYAHPNDELDFAKIIVDLMENPVRRKTMGQMGRERVKTELAWSHQVKQLFNAYESLFSE